MPPSSSSLPTFEEGPRPAGVGPPRLRHRPAGVDAAPLRASPSRGCSEVGSSPSRGGSPLPSPSRGWSGRRLQQGSSPSSSERGNLGRGPAGRRNLSRPGGVSGNSRVAQAGSRSSRIAQAGFRLFERGGCARVAQAGSRARLLRSGRIAQAGFRLLESPGAFRRSGATPVDRLGGVPRGEVAQAGASGKEKGLGAGPGAGLGAGRGPGAGPGPGSGAGWGAEPARATSFSNRSGLGSRHYRQFFAKSFAKNWRSSTRRRAGVGAGGRFSEKIVFGGRHYRKFFANLFAKKK